MARPAGASVVATPPVHFDASLIASGWTLRLNQGANITVFPGILPAEADITWSASNDPAPALPAKMKLLGQLYYYSVSGAPSFNPGTRKFAITLPKGDSTWSQSIWMYDRVAGAWTKLPTKLNATTNRLQAGFLSTDAYFAVLEDNGNQTGIASWYCKLHCSSRYPTLHGTSNDFPVGSYVTVTSTETNKSVTVKIISKWGQPAGRVVDLSWAAFSKLQSKNKGLTRVVVTPKASSAPTVTTSSYLVTDALTSKILAEKRAETKRPLASITKLMTAAVFLDTHPDLNNIVTYSQADVTAYAYLRVSPGETMSLKDLFYSMLVGSANNASTALARSTGMTIAEFVAKMNAQAKAWGMMNTTFVDTSGLDPKNVSTARDIAILNAHTFSDYPDIRKATVAKSYSFTTRNTQKPHYLKSTDTLLTTASGLNIIGGKTGYLDEAKYTYTMMVKSKTGNQYTITLLGSASSKVRFSEASQLATWATTNFH